MIVQVELGFGYDVGRHLVRLPGHCAEGVANYLDALLSFERRHYWCAPFEESEELRRQLWEMAALRMVRNSFGQIVWDRWRAEDRITAPDFEPVMMDRPDLCLDGESTQWKGGASQR